MLNAIVYQLYFLYTGIIFIHFKEVDITKFQNYMSALYFMQAFMQECVAKIFFLFLNQTYIVGTQKNRLSEKVLLSPQNICYN